MVVALSKPVVAQDGHPLDQCSCLYLEFVFLVVEAFLRVSLSLIKEWFWLGPDGLWLAEALEEIMACG